jgi:hypothetical protein
MATLPHLLGRLTASALRSAGAFDFAAGFALECASGPLRSYLADRRDDLLDALDALRDTDWSRLARATAPLVDLAAAMRPPAPPGGPGAPPAPEGPPQGAAEPPPAPPAASARPVGYDHDCAHCGVPTSLAPYVPPAGQGEGIPSLCPPCLEKHLEAKVVEAEARADVQQLYESLRRDFGLPPTPRIPMPYIAPTPRAPSAAPFGVARLFPTQRNRPAKA